MEDTDIIEALKEFETWLVVRKLSPATVKAYRRYCANFIVGLRHQLSENYIERFLIKHPSSTARAFVSNFLEFQGIKDLKVPKIKGNKKIVKRRMITHEEFIRMRKWFYKKSFRYGLMFEISFKCALRRDEICNIPLTAFDFEEYEEMPKKKGYRVLIKGKGNKERNVMIPNLVMKRLHSYVLRKVRVTEFKRLFPNRSKWHNVFKQCIKELKLHNYTLHDLRRSRATQWLQKGVDIYRVSKRLGHADVSTTQKYINLQEEEELELWSEEDF